jgi:peptide/nickel transport system permease protein
VRDYVLRRLALLVPTLLVASLAVFLVVRALPGDVIGAVLGGEGEALRPELAAAMRAELDLDAPLSVQYGRWLWRMVNGELGGRSLVTREPIAELVSRQLPVTALLSSYALLLAVATALPLGALAAARRGRLLDIVVRTVAAAGAALPGFWVALLALLLAVTLLRWSPPLVYVAPWVGPLDHLGMMVIPALVLAWELGSHLLRTTRAATLDALAQDFVRTAIAKGLPPRDVLRHALRSAAVPVVTVVGLHLGTLLGGAVILEAIFGLPGIGRGLVQAVVARDYPVVQSLALVLVTIVVALDLVVDLLYTVADPRIAYG